MFSGFTARIKPSSAEVLFFFSASLWMPVVLDLNHVTQGVQVVFVTHGLVLLDQVVVQVFPDVRPLLAVGVLVGDLGQGVVQLEFPVTRGRPPLLLHFDSGGARCAATTRLADSLQLRICGPLGSIETQLLSGRGQRASA